MKKRDAYKSMIIEKYKMSFTTGGLFLVEGVKLAEIFLELKDWKLVQQTVIKQNTLQSRTVSTTKRTMREIVARLLALSEEELKFLISIGPKEQGYLLWIALCRQYRFIADFAVEVIREKLLSLRYDLSYEDYDLFFNQKTEEHPELDALSPSSRNKLRQVLFKSLREAELLNPNNSINIVIPTPGFRELLRKANSPSIMYLPLGEPFERSLK
jgi:hypothetical protein